MRSLISILLIIVPYLAISQGKGAVSNLQKAGSEWSDGTLFLKDETILKGKIQYNDKNGALSLKTEEGSDSYSANTVLKFSFFYKILNGYRNFISLDYPMENLKKGIINSYSLTDFDSRKSKGPIVPTFFEVLRETNEFALLSKIKPIKYKEKASGGASHSPTGVVYSGPVTVFDEIKQNEIIFLLNANGDIAPYIEFVNKEIYNTSFKDSKGSKSTKKRKIDSDLLEEVIGELYPQLMEYAKANKLKTTRRDDLLKIIDHYILLLDQNKK
jgi:hypothetical protein